MISKQCGQQTECERLYVLCMFTFAWFLLVVECSQTIACWVGTNGSRVKLDPRWQVEERKLKTKKVTKWWWKRKRAHQREVWRRCCCYTSSIQFTRLVLKQLTYNGKAFDYRICIMCGLCRSYKNQLWKWKIGRVSCGHFLCYSRRKWCIRWCSLTRWN